ncbi:MAG: hypothetical protein LBC75_00135 [Fibromonadaceae bacterium]|jgi:uncharacterized protein (TIGR02145 family)|nr:hypothetical protein [Fibromonadaceae bacterium]
MNKITTLLFLCTTLFAQQKGTFTDTRDGKIYKTTKIGEQVWMAENLNYEAKGSKCYEHKPANCKKYGKLYDWETAMKSCPKGWHLPSIAEWSVISAEAGNDVSAKNLKTTSGWNDYRRGSGNGYDKFGFSALPGGSGDSDGGFGNLFKVGEYGVWWSSSGGVKSKDNSNIKGCWTMANNEDDIDWHSCFKSRLNSVRCVQD